MTDIEPDSLFQTAANITWRDIRGELIALQLDSGEYFSFNEIGRLVWLAVTEGQTPRQALARIAAEYDIEPEQAEADVSAFLQGLLDGGLLALKAP